MSRYVPILTTAFFVAAALSAEAHSPRPRPATGLVLSDSSRQLTAFTGLSSAQETDDVAAKVKARLQADPDLGSHSSEVTVTGAAGIVTLEGTVPTVQIRARIAELVMKTEGVTKVNNKMKLAKK
jgi:osmotically-inducible protein OsmY